MAPFKDYTILVIETVAEYKSLAISSLTFITIEFKSKVLFKLELPAFKNLLLEVDVISIKETTKTPLLIKKLIILVNLFI